MAAEVKGSTRSATAARLGYSLAELHCRACRAYHSVWPYLRLIDPPRGVDADREQLLGILDPLLFSGAKVLIAGSADAGLAECMLDAAGNRSVGLTVIDLCETPLRQCEALLGARAEGGLVTLRASISGPPVASPVDLVLAHSVLSFLPRGEIAHAGGFLHDSLRPGGRLVITTALGWAAPKFEEATFRRHVLAELAARSIPLPGGETAFGALLDDYARGRRRRESPFATVHEFAGWLEAAGLEIETMLDLRRGSGFASDGSPLARVKSGALVVARKSGAR